MVSWISWCMVLGIGVVGFEHNQKLELNLVLGHLDDECVTYMSVKATSRTNFYLLLALAKRFWNQLGSLCKFLLKDPPLACCECLLPHLLVKISRMISLKL